MPIPINPLIAKIRLIRLSVAALIIGLLVASANAAELPTIKPEKVGFSSQRLKRLDAVMQDYVDNEQYAGSVVLLAREGKVFYHKAFGLRDREAGDAMQPDTIFRIASQTKAIVSVGAMVLQEQGKLLITDPVGHYLPAFMQTQVAEPLPDGSYKIVQAKRPITIRDLLTHTSGVGYGRGPASDLWQQAGIQDWYFADRDEAIVDTVVRMAQLPFDAQPGERWVYGYNTDILGAVLEKASGQALDQFLQQQVLQPLGMHDTQFYLSPEKAKRLAAVYRPGDNGGLQRSPDNAGLRGQGHYVEGPRKSFSGGAGLLSTAADYAKFLQMMLNRGELNQTRILGPKSVELMTTDHLGDIFFRPGTGFGLGFGIVKNPGLKGELSSVGEFEWGGAYHSVYWGDPKEKLLVVYFTQLLPGEHLDDHRKLRALVYQALMDTR